MSHIFPGVIDTAPCQRCGDPIEQTECVGGESLWHCSYCEDRCTACHDEDRNRA